MEEDRGILMKTLLLATTAAVAFLAPAQAADMPVKARPPAAVEAVFNWTGFYIGAHLGFARSNQRATSVDPVSEPAAGKIRGSSLIGGVHAGYNFALAQRFVAGVEVDFTGADLDGSAFDTNRVGAAVLAGGITFQHEVRWLATVRGRLGYAVMPTWLIYGTGGAAWASVHYRTVDIHAAGPAFPAIFDVKDTKSGWVAGGGMEFALSGNWLFRAEYLHYDIQGASASGVPRVGFPAELSTFTHGRLKIDSVRGGISYKFGGGDPILARF
jgi:outer membrane immunogenic protein